LEDLPLLIGLHQAIAAMELVFYYCFTVFCPQRLGICFLCLFWVHQADHLLPLEDRISVGAVGVDQDHHAALAAEHVPQDIFEIGFVLMLIVEVDDFLLQQLPLEHVLDCKFFRSLDLPNDFF
jgi:hypothetical protein